MNQARRRGLASPSTIAEIRPGLLWRRTLDLITVVLAEYGVGRWWVQLLPDHRILRPNAARLLLLPDVVVIDIAWRLRSTG